jgi:hypothetical protein
MLTVPEQLPAGRQNDAGSDERQYKGMNEYIEALRWYVAENLPNLFE